MAKAQDVVDAVYALSDPKRAETAKWFFKTGKGEYGEGDVFSGLTVPTCRMVARQYRDISQKDISLLLQNKVHEVRLIALLILVSQYKKADQAEREKIVGFYLKHTKYINNWDLVDTSAYHILGDFLLHRKDKSILLKLARSKSLWEERIAIVATFAFIRAGELDWTYKIAHGLEKHSHDLIHKACGWMLREAGKKDEKRLKEYLDRKASTLPRTMLRYAIEKFSEVERLKYLQK
jgi:3-methyladenine DNA glycosylase AlkD